MLSSQNEDQLIIGAVEEHYATHDSPYYLAELGKVFRSKDIEIPHGVRFKDYLKIQFQGRLVVVQDADNPERIAIAPPEKEYDVLQRLSGQYRDTPDDSSVDYERLPIALIAAFCKVPLPGAHVYFHIKPPFHYRTSTNAPDDSYVPIEDRFRLQSFEGKSVRELSDKDEQQIFQQIEKWAKEKSLDLRDLYYDRNRRSTASPKDSEGNALARLLNAQEPELRRRLRIPGDIADLLMRSP